MGQAHTTKFHRNVQEGPKAELPQELAWRRVKPTLPLAVRHRHVYCRREKAEGMLESSLWLYYRCKRMIIPDIAVHDPSVMHWSERGWRVGDLCFECCKCFLHRSTPGVLTMRRIRRLLIRGANPNEVNNDGGRRMACMHYAAKGGFTQLCELLAIFGANIDLQNVQRQTPLSLACAMGHMRTAHMLLNYGADPNMVDFDGHSPLYYATYYGHGGTVHKLLAKGASQLLFAEKLAPLDLLAQKLGKGSANMRRNIERQLASALAKEHAGRKTAESARRAAERQRQLANLMARLKIPASKRRAQRHAKRVAADLREHAAAERERRRAAEAEKQRLAQVSFEADAKQRFLEREARFGTGWSKGESTGAWAEDAGGEAMWKLYGPRGVGVQGKQPDCAAYWDVAVQELLNEDGNEGSGQCSDPDAVVPLDCDDDHELTGMRIKPAPKSKGYIKKWHKNRAGKIGTSQSAQQIASAGRASVESSRRWHAARSAMGVATPQRGLVQRQRDDELDAEVSPGQATQYSGIARREERRRGRRTRSTTGTARIAPDLLELEVDFSQLRERKHEIEQWADGQDVSHGDQVVPSEQVQKSRWPHAHTDGGNKLAFATIEGSTYASEIARAGAEGIIHDDNEKRLRLKLQKDDMTQKTKAKTKSLATDSMIPWKPKTPVIRDNWCA